MGEGWGEGEYNVISLTYTPLPLIPSRQGRGNLTFYEFINTDSVVKNPIYCIVVILQKQIIDIVPTMP
jgi:hypothetical protein